MFVHSYFLALEEFRCGAEPSRNVHDGHTAAKCHRIASPGPRSHQLHRRCNYALVCFRLNFFVCVLNFWFVNLNNVSKNNTLCYQSIGSTCWRNVSCSLRCYFWNNKMAGCCAHFTDSTVFCHILVIVDLFMWFRDGAGIGCAERPCSGTPAATMPVLRHRLSSRRNSGASRSWRGTTSAGRSSSTRSGSGRTSELAPVELLWLPSLCETDLADVQLDGGHIFNEQITSGTARIFSHS